MTDAKSEGLASTVRVGLLAARIARGDARAVGHASVDVLSAITEPITAAVLRMTVRARLHGTFVWVLGVVLLGEEQHYKQHLCSRQLAPTSLPAVLLRGEDGAPGQRDCYYSRLPNPPQVVLLPATPGLTDRRAGICD